jgi:hypothetical protein
MWEYEFYGNRVAILVLDMKILVGEFLMLLRLYGKYFNDIGKDTSPGKND